MYTLDTNAIIYYLKDDRLAVKILRDIFEQNVPIYISAVTEVELFGFSQITPDEEQKLEIILNTLAVLPLDSKIARIAGVLRRQFGLKTADSVIAATTLFTGTTLITRNLRDFQKITNLPLLAT